MWIARGITAWQELDSRKLERFAGETAKLTACGPAGRRQGLGGADAAWQVAKEGYPVRTVDRSGGGAGMLEVVRAEGRALPAPEFQPPAGFVRRTLREMMGH